MSAIPQASVTERNFVPLVVLIAALLLTVLAYHESFQDLLHFWLAPDAYDFSHGSVLMALSLIVGAYIIWRDPDAISVRPNPTGALALLITTACWVIASLLVVEVGTRLAFWFLFPSLVLALFGWQGVRRLWLPLVLPLFGIPIWTELHEPLRLGTAHAVTWLLRIGGVSTLLEGSTISVPAGSFYVADACTGMRQLVVAMPLSLLYTGWVGLRFRYGAMLFLAAALLSIILNTLRILIVVVAGNLTAMQHYFVRKDHVTLGWVLFGVGMFLFFFTASRLIPQSWLLADHHPRLPERLREPLKLPAVAVVSCALLIMLATPLAAKRFVAASGTHRLQALTLPVAVSGWAVDSGDSMPNVDASFVGADDEVMRFYSDGRGRTVMVAIARYRTQRSGHEAASWANSSYVRANWHLLTDRLRTVNSDSKTFQIREIVAANLTGQRRVVWTWYQVAGRESVSIASAKLLGLRGLLCGRFDASMIVLAADPGLDIDAERATLVEFLDEAYPTFRAQLMRGKCN